MPEEFRCSEGASDAVRTGGVLLAVTLLYVGNFCVNCGPGVHSGDVLGDSGGPDEGVPDLTGMVEVPAGSALIGCRAYGEPDPEECGESAELQHEVIVEGFWIDRYEVTNREFAEFLNTSSAEGVDSLFWERPPRQGFKMDAVAQVYWSGTAWEVRNDAGEHPAVNMTWHGAGEFCRWRNKRLPTAVEWEKAARGTEGALYPWGDAGFGDPCANHPIDNVFFTAEVGTYPQDESPFGAMDMACNVREWVQDVYPGTMDDRTTMGTSWASLGLMPMFNKIGAPESPPHSETDYAWGEAIAYRVGFRCAVSASSAESSELL